MNVKTLAFLSIVTLGASYASISQAMNPGVPGAPLRPTRTMRLAPANMQQAQAQGMVVVAAMTPRIAPVAPAPAPTAIPNGSHQTPTKR